MSIVAEPTTWDRVLDLLDDGDWHAEEELEEVAYYPEHWIGNSRNAATRCSGAVTDTRGCGS